MKSCAVGIAERQEKLILMIAGILLLAIPQSNVWMGFLNMLPDPLADVMIALGITNILTACLVIVAVLSHVTVVQRLAYARKVIGESERQAQASA